MKKEELILLAKNVKINPPFNKAIFYHGERGAQNALAFKERNPSYKRIDDLLIESEEGKNLYSVLTGPNKPSWNEAKEVWWILSHRLAERASGVVHCFGEKRDILPDGSVHQFQSKFDSRYYCDTTFDKVEQPVLINNPRVTKIFYNNKEYK